MLRDTTIKQLRALAETIRTRSLTRAAQALNVTPPAISQQLKLLEAAAGISLLQKDETGFRATAAGAELVIAAQRIEAILRECSEALAAQRDGELGHVNLGAVSTAKYFAPRALAAFRLAHPRVDLSLSIGNREETIQALESYELDLAVMGRPPEHFEVEQEEIGPHPHVIIAPPRHRLAGRVDVALDELSAETFLMREAGSGTRLLTQQLLAQLRRAPRIGMEISSNETIKQAVMAGLGIALISAHTVSIEISDGQLTIIHADGLPIVRTWYVVRRKDRRLLPTAAAMWSFLVERALQFLPAIPP